MKDKSEIRKELMRLMIAELEASVVSKYYTDQITRMLTAAIEKSEELTKSVRVEGLSDEEREKLRFQLRHAELEGRHVRKLLRLSAVWQTKRTEKQMKRNRD
jgi:hypothetical protein